MFFIIGFCEIVRCEIVKFLRKKTRPPFTWKGGRNATLKNRDTL